MVVGIIHIPVTNKELNIYAEQRENTHYSCSQEVYSQAENDKNDTNNYKKKQNYGGAVGRYKDNGSMAERRNSCLWL